MMLLSWGSLTVGFFFGGFNMWLLDRLVRALVQTQHTQKWKIGVYFLLKMALIFVTIGLILKKGYVSPLPFLAGFTVSLVAGILFKTLKMQPK